LEYDRSDPLGENAVQFRLPEAFAPFMDYLSFGIIPQHLLGDFHIRKSLIRLSTWSLGAAVLTDLNA
jgi:hypothetical protein